MIYFSTLIEKNIVENVTNYWRIEVEYIAFNHLRKKGQRNLAKMCYKEKKLYSNVDQCIVFRYFCLGTVIWM